MRRKNGGKQYNKKTGPEFKYWSGTQFGDAAISALRAGNAGAIAGIDFMRGQLERCPSTSRLHVQFWIGFERKLTRTAAVARFRKAGMDGVRLEPSIGNAAQNDRYTGKCDSRVPAEEGGFSISIGTIVEKQPGRRSDLERLHALVKAGKNLKEIYEAEPIAYMKFNRAVKEAIQLQDEPPEWRVMKVTYIWGKTGQGKTRKAYELARQHPTDKRLYRVNYRGEQTVFDRYRGEKTVLLDEFYGQIPISDLLQILDGYPIWLKARYNDLAAHFTHVVITANKSPEYLYSGVPEEIREALMRRINTVIHISSATRSVKPPTYEVIDLTEDL